MTQESSAGMGPGCSPSHTPTPALAYLKQESWGPGDFQKRRVLEVYCKARSLNRLLLAQSRNLFCRGGGQFHPQLTQTLGSTRSKLRPQQHPSSERESECWTAQGGHGTFLDRLQSGPVQSGTCCLGLFSSIPVPFQAHREDRC